MNIEQDKKGIDYEAWAEKITSLRRYAEDGSTEMYLRALASTIRADVLRQAKEKSHEE